MFTPSFPSLFGMTCRLLQDGAYSGFGVLRRHRADGRDDSKSQAFSAKGEMTQPTLDCANTRCHIHACSV